MTPTKEAPMKDALTTAKSMVVETENLKPEAVDLPCRTILSAIGHPGYGEGFAKDVILSMARYGMSSHEAIYGGVSAGRKIYEVRGW